MHTIDYTSSSLALAFASDDLPVNTCVLYRFIALISLILGKQCAVAICCYRQSQQLTWQ